MSFTHQTAYSPEAREKNSLVSSFEQNLAEHKDEIDVLQFFYSIPCKKRLRFKDIDELAKSIESPRAHGQPKSVTSRPV